jgi:hypothetical protein
MNTENLNIDLAEELQDDPEFFPENEEADDYDDFFDDNGDIVDTDNGADDDAGTGDDFFDDGSRTVAKLEYTSVATFLHTFNAMLASTISNLTGEDKRRYMPAKSQTNEVAKAFVKAFPTVNALNPKWAFIFVFVMTYAPVTTNIIKDLKINKIEKGSTDNNSRYQWNGQNNSAE